MQHEVETVEATDEKRVNVTLLFRGDATEDELHKFVENFLKFSSHRDAMDAALAGANMDDVLYDGYEVHYE